MGRTDKKDKPQFKKAKHGSLGEKVDKRRLDREEELDVEYATNSTYWESYCGACDYFETEECPFKGKVTNITRWGIDINCKKFMD